MTTFKVTVLSSRGVVLVRFVKGRTIEQVQARFERLADYVASITVEVA